MLAEEHYLSLLLPSIVNSNNMNSISIVGLEKKVPFLSFKSFLLKSYAFQSVLSLSHACMCATINRLIFKPKSSSSALKWQIKKPKPLTVALGFPASPPAHHCSHPRPSWEQCWIWSQIQTCRRKPSQTQWDFQLQCTKESFVVPHELSMNELWGDKWPPHNIGLFKLNYYSFIQNDDSWLSE